MNRNKMAMALCIALLVSGICTAVLARQISGRKKTAQVENSYVALAKPVVGGTVIKLDDLKMIAWPANVPLSGGFTKTQDVIGRTALVTMAQDSPVMNQNLAAPGAGVGSARAPPATANAAASARAAADFMPGLPWSRAPSGRRR